MKSLGKY